MDRLQSYWGESLDHENKIMIKCKIKIKKVAKGHEAALRPGGSETRPYHATLVGAGLRPARGFCG